MQLEEATKAVERIASVYANKILASGALEGLDLRQSRIEDECQGMLIEIGRELPNISILWVEAMTQAAYFIIKEILRIRRRT